MTPFDKTNDIAPIPPPLVFFLLFVFAPFLHRAVTTKRTYFILGADHNPKHRMDGEAREICQQLSPWRKYHHTIATHVSKSLEQIHTHYFCAPVYILVFLQQPAHRLLANQQHRALHRWLHSKVTIYHVSK